MLSLSRMLVYNSQFVRIAGSSSLISHPQPIRQYSSGNKMQVLLRSDSVTIHIFTPWLVR